MIALKPLRAKARHRVGLIDPGMLCRLILSVAALAALSLAALPTLANAASPAGPNAGQAPRLRGDVLATGDILTLGDLVENAPASFAGRPLFRAPALGATGTIQAKRILEAADRLDLGPVETGGRLQISVQRAARRVGPAEIEAALKAALQSGHGLEAKTLAIRLDGEAPLLLAPVALDGAASATDLSYDPRSRRVTALIVLGDRQASLRVSGLVTEMRETAVLTRALTRGETVGPSDIVLERRPREGAGADVMTSAGAAIGQIAQRSLSAGAMLRSGDLAPPDLVQRGEAVSIVFEAQGVSLSLRGIANESGRLGASIAVLNPASKKVLQGSVIGPGRVSVSPPRVAQPVAQADASLARPGIN